MVVLKELKKHRYIVQINMILHIIQKEEMKQ